MPRVPVTHPPLRTPTCPSSGGKHKGNTVYHALDSSPDRRRDTPSVLESRIGVARRAVEGVARDVHGRVHGAVSEWIGIEHAVERRVKALIAPGEPLTPAMLYVGVASLSGSILARNRSVLTRVMLPPAFFLLSFNYFLPKTSHNVSDYAGSLEEAHFPALAQKHAVAIAHTQMTWERARAAGVSGRDWLQSGLGGAARRVQDLTGLKVLEALGGRSGAATATTSHALAPERGGDVPERMVRDVAREADQRAREVVQCV
ncbi:apolipo protein O-domain-containing protein [Russula vinacea]|nr:apolipo protein O-domain-containing protein [Russula vinacea]